MYLTQEDLRETRWEKINLMFCSVPQLVESLVESVGSGRQSVSVFNSTAGPWIKYNERGQTDIFNIPHTNRKHQMSHIHAYTKAGRHTFLYNVETTNIIIFQVLKFTHTPCGLAQANHCPPVRVHRWLGWWFINTSICVCVIDKRGGQIKFQACKITNMVNRIWCHAQGLRLVKD